MIITDLLDEQSILLELEISDKEEAFKVLIDTFKTTGKLNDTQTALEAVIEREKALSTGVGSGVAVPHANLKTIEIPLIAFGRIKKGLPFGAIDEKPVQLIFLLLVPENQLSTHLKLLSRISRICSDSSMRKNLLNSKEPSDIIRHISEAETELVE